MSTATTVIKGGLQVDGTSTLVSATVNSDGISMGASKTISSASGNLTLNAPTGSGTSFRVNNSEAASIKSTGLEFNGAKTISATDSMTVAVPDGKTVNFNVNNADRVRINNNGVLLLSNRSLQSETTLTLNAPTGNVINMQVNGATSAQVSTDGIVMPVNKTISFGANVTKKMAIFYQGVNDASTSYMGINSNKFIANTGAASSISMQIGESEIANIDSTGIICSNLRTTSGAMVLQAAGNIDFRTGTSTTSFSANTSGIALPVNRTISFGANVTKKMAIFFQGGTDATTSYMGIGSSKFIVNTATGGALSVQIGEVEIATVDSTGLALAAGKTITADNMPVDLDSGAITAAWSSGVQSSQNFTINLVRSGKIVSLLITPGANVTSNGSGAISSGIYVPSDYRPTNTFRSHLFRVQINAGFEAAYFTITNVGTISFNRMNGSNFTNGDVVSVPQINITYGIQ